MKKANRTITIQAVILGYSRMGFKTTGPTRQKNGIIFVPMAYDLD